MIEFDIIAVIGGVIIMYGKMTNQRIRVTDLLMFILGAAIYAWSLVNINIPNSLAEGGVTGITLILRALFGLNPAYTTILLNIPLLFFGFRMMGRRALIYTLFGTLKIPKYLFNQ